MEEELVGWSRPESSGQQFNIQIETGDKLHPSGVRTGTSSV